MKKLTSVLLLLLLIMTSLAGCSPNKKPEEQSRTDIKKELETETAVKKEAENLKTQKVDVKDKNALYEFVRQDIKGLSRENFNLWQINYLDITGDGNDEAVIAGFVISDNNLKFLGSKIGSNMIAEIKKGKKLKVKAVVDKYAFYAKDQTSPMWSCNITDIVNFE